MRDRPIKQIVKVIDPSKNELLALQVELSLTQQQFAIQLKSADMLKSSVMYEAGVYAFVAHIKGIVAAALFVCLLFRYGRNRNQWRQFQQCQRQH